MKVNDNLQQVCDRLVRSWRERAEEFERHQCGEVASTYQHVSTELEQAVESWGITPLNLTEAARESGYSREYLGRSVSSGKIPNAGKPNAPKILQRDLPIKSANLPGSPGSVDSCVTSKGDVVRSVVAQGKGTR